MILSYDPSNLKEKPRRNSLRYSILWLGILWGIATTSQSALAKNLESRVGVGLSILDFNRTPALSIRLHPTTHLATTLMVGFNTDTTANITAVGIQAHRYTSLEENLNFFLGAQALLISDKGGTQNLSTGIELDGLLGVEFFFLGISNLGLQLQTGVGMKTIRNFALKIVGDGFAGFAFHYYF